MFFLIFLVVIVFVFIGILFAFFLIPLILILVLILRIEVVFLLATDLVLDPLHFFDLVDILSKITCLVLLSGLFHYVVHYWDVVI